MAQELSLFDFYEEETLAPAQEYQPQPEQEMVSVAKQPAEPEQFAQQVAEQLPEEPELPEPTVEKPARSDKKLYYSIGEVAQMFDLNASNLRFWEKEFSILKPRTNKKGTRFYTHSDIENIKLICYLVKQQGLTLEGARKRLKNNLAETKRNAEIAERLLALKQEIKAMQEEINE